MSYNSPKGGIKTAAEVKSDEKADMRKLNDKLALYVEKVRQLGAGGSDSAAFLASLRNVEDEVNKQRALYEAELSSLRQQLDVANREKNNSLTETEKYKRAASDFEDRFRTEADKNGRLINDINLLQQRIAALEQELAKTRAAMQVPQTHLAGAQNDLKQALARNDDLARQLEQERAKAKQLQDKLNNVQKQIDFNEQAHNEQLKDANNRLNQTKDIIIKVEERAKQLESQNSSMPEMLEQMRRKTEKEIDIYKANVEADNKRNLAALRNQLAGQERSIEQLKRENGQLQIANDNLEAKMRTMESQIRDLKVQKSVLEDHVNKERARGAEQIRALERKLKDLQDLLNKRMQEMSANREVQMSLRAEIEAMRVLLEEEERRLGGPIAPRNTMSRSCAKLSSDDLNRSKVDRPQSAKGNKAPLKYGRDPVTEYTYSYKPEEKNRGCGGHMSGVKRDGNPVRNSWSGHTTRSRTSNDGFPKLTTDNTCKAGWTTGGTMPYTNTGRRNETTYTSAYCGRRALPKVC